MRRAKTSCRHFDHDRVELAQHGAVDERLLWQFLHRLVPGATLASTRLGRVRLVGRFLTLERHATKQANASAAHWTRHRAGVEMERPLWSTTMASPSMMQLSTGRLAMASTISR